MRRVAIARQQARGWRRRQLIRVRAVLVSRVSCWPGPGSSAAGVAVGEEPGLMMGRYPAERRSAASMAVRNGVGRLMKHSGGSGEFSTSIETADTQPGRALAADLQTAHESNRIEYRRAPVSA